MNVDHGGEPHLIDVARMVLAVELDTYVATMPGVDELAMFPGFPPTWAGQRGIIFEFAAPGLPDKVRAFVPASAFPPGTGEEFRFLFDRLHDPEAQAELDAATARAREANYLSGRLPGSPVIHCPGCGSRLFGEVARRGGCLACYADLPPGDAQAIEVAP